MRRDCVSRRCSLSTDFSELAHLVAVVRPAKSSSVSFPKFGTNDQLFGEHRARCNTDRWSVNESHACLSRIGQNGRDGGPLSGLEINPTIDTSERLGRVRTPRVRVCGNKVDARTCVRAIRRTFAGNAYRIDRRLRRKCERRSFVESKDSSPHLSAHGCGRKADA